MRSSCLNEQSDYVEEIVKELESRDISTHSDQDVYDGVAWSVVAPLSEQSVARKSKAVDFPDFTRGLWKQT